MFQASNDSLKNLTLKELTGETRELAELIGLDAFKKLVAYYGGTSRLYVPSLKSQSILQRNASIYKDFQAGLNVNELSQKWGLSDRWIQQIIKEGRIRSNEK